MAKKVLYLGSGKWCYTEACKQHAGMIAAKNAFVAARKSGDEEALKAASNTLLSSQEGRSALNYIVAQDLRDKLGRAPTIGLDLDGTSGSFTDGLRWHMATKEPIRIPKKEWAQRFPDPDRYDYHEGTNPWFTSREDFVTHFKEAEKRGVYKQIPIYPNASKTLNELKNLGFKIKVVTARNADFNADTSAWLKKNAIPYTGLYNPGHAKEQVKGIDVYMDDAPVVINRLLSHQKKVVVMTQRYNQDGLDESENSRRVQDWQDDVVGAIFDLLDENKKKK
jgi:uncharacterized HAD superfamily protein